MSNSSMSYLNVSVSGLRGKHHPAISNLLTTLDVHKSRPHLKMLCQDYLTYEKKADQSGGSPHCRCCSSDLLEERHKESLEHILTECVAYSEVRERIMQELKSLCNKSRSRPDFENILIDRRKLCQFILDPTSLNLPSRICSNEPNLESFFRKSRDLCFSIHNRRMDILKKKKELAVTK